MPNSAKIQEQLLDAPARAQGAFQRLLLASGVLSSMLYVFTDVVGGLRYPGYSFTSQAISELGAIGAPSESFVDPLFVIYNVLVVLFGIGVAREAAGRGRGLRITGALLTAYGAIGILGPIVMGPTFFKMEQRGVGTVAGDLPHILLTAALVLLMLLAIGFGAFAFGRRFRVYSFATMATIVALGALTVPYAARLAAGEPTPGFGIVERIDVYSLLLWIAVLAGSLLRLQWTRTEARAAS